MNLFIARMKRHRLHAEQERKVVTGCEEEEDDEALSVGFSTPSAGCPQASSI